MLALGGGHGAGVGISELAWSVLWFECICPYSNSCWGLFPPCGSVGRWNLLGGIWIIRVESSWMHACLLPQVSLLSWDWTVTTEWLVIKNIKIHCPVLFLSTGCLISAFPQCIQQHKSPTKSRTEATGTLLLDSSSPAPQNLLAS